MSNNDFSGSGHRVKRYEKMAAAVEAVEGGTRSGAALPAQAELWEATVSGRRRLDPPLPKADL